MSSCFFYFWSKGGIAFDIKNKINFDISLKDYLIYWYDEIYSSRVEATARMLGQYTLYYLIFPQLERNIKLRYANTEFFNAIIKERERYEERRKKAGEKFYDFGFIFRYHFEFVLHFFSSQ